jgi:hypothetical protein
LTTKNLSVLATKGLVLGKLEGHDGINIRNMSQMAIGSKNDPTKGLKIHPKMGMGPGVRVKCVNGPMKKLKSESFLFKLHHL